jgi:hypothetical protein
MTTHLNQACLQLFASMPDIKAADEARMRERLERELVEVRLPALLKDPGKLSTMQLFSQLHNTPTPHRDGEEFVYRVLYCQSLSGLLQRQTLHSKSHIFKLKSHILVS